MATKQPAALDPATAATLTDTAAAAVDAIIASTGEIPTKAEIETIVQDDLKARQARAFVGETRIAPDSAV